MPKDKQWNEVYGWFVELSGWIAGPVIVALLAGSFLDKRFNTQPWIMLILVGMAFIVTNTVIARIGIRQMKKIERENKSESHNQLNKPNGAAEQ